MPRRFDLRPQSLLLVLPLATLSSACTPEPAPSPTLVSGLAQGVAIREPEPAVTLSCQLGNMKAPTYDLDGPCDPSS
ncbi:MAG: hypothetical protein KC731_15635 [Myxococcales bacterium]|nr:hypothetical protein [Myxococcales bacterium]